MPVRSIPIEDITIPNGRREPMKGRIASVARSMKENGQLQPIGLTEDYKLIFGRTRIEAAKCNGWKTIEAQIFDVDALHAELMEIDENIERSSLTAFEEGQVLSRRKAIYLELHPETAVGGDHNSSTAKELADRQNGDLKRFTADTAEQTGKSERVIQRDIATAEAIVPAAGEIIKDTPVADKKGQLEALSKLPAAEQVKVAKRIKSGKAKSVKEATKPPEKDATPADKAKAQITIWADAIGRWLGKSPSIDELRAEFPGPKGDGVVKLATALFEAMKGWQKAIK